MLSKNIGMILFLNILMLSATFSFAQEKGTVQLLFSIPENDFYPENIAYDSKTDTWFLGSMSQQRIIKINRDGSYQDFLKEPCGRLFSSVGMKVDPGRRALWVCTGTLELLKNYGELAKKTGILRFDIDSGKLTASWFLKEDMKTQFHIFNDIVLADDGSAYATTTLLGGLYKIDKEEGKLQLLHQLKAGDNNNGVTLDESCKFIFMTNVSGILRLDLESGKTLQLAGSAAGEFSGCDGIYFYQNSIVAVKPRFNQILKITLDPKLEKSVKVETVSQGNPEFAFPTTGVITGDDLVVVATSYANVPRNPGEKQHDDIKIFKIPLK